MCWPVLLIKATQISGRWGAAVLDMSGLDTKERGVCVCVCVCACVCVYGFLCGYLHKAPAGSIHESWPHLVIWPLPTSKMWLLYKVAEKSTPAKNLLGEKRQCPKTSKGAHYTSWSDVPWVWITPAGRVMEQQMKSQLFLTPRSMLWWIALFFHLVNLYYPNIEGSV